ncbi:pyridoxamine 5'-phosphate oxidase family protein [Vannielia litorea]|uniref:pyridoxamine 5'-phosphate oxidase family protein n=1 Tax=Vannielia litorea TaxID=1217970 RepID=UPI001C9894CD|nr:pyridoxamine 5'-phosphate oxidase family protein [Vannielia litorea]MBY6047724.1 pyridoxamine 5'-phosphate oxidase family protein [Vannielia litorea]MBY6075138.1 pyridoxamine 5'-phosphate oxidase family protein [Vannielia litorea]
MEFEDVVADEAALRALYPAVSELAEIKSMAALDAHARAFIARSPFVCIGTQGAGGRADVSPRGDAPGFVEVLGDRLLAIPDRPGNNRLDSLANILANGAVGLLFMVPGFDETLRVNGRAKLVRDAALLERMAVNGRAPRLAVVVEVEEVFLHCAKAFRRSKLWDPAARQDRGEMPSLSKMILDQTRGAPEDEGEMAKIDAGLEEAYAKSMY